MSDAMTDALDYEEPYNPDAIIKQQEQEIAALREKLIALSNRERDLDKIINATMQERDALQRKLTEVEAALDSEIASHRGY